ncbi:MAG: phosphoribosylformylglycinamidine synthase I [Sulfolobales archaeon]|nr:phosphoribosylformylglycinamidine synthase I [Sulfolobales archaeon]MDW8082882.1 phosphoribosylformylglycinamidine synthase I [Sulfolobales archaeon]
MPKIAILKFPGTNCDEDVLKSLREVGREVRAEIVWHKDFRLADGWDAVIVPGGFSYGDWLRAGAIAARSRAVLELPEAAIKSVPVLGICNGFQILVEAGLLRGAFLPNESGRFICRWVRLRVDNPKGPWLSLAKNGDELHMPIAHGEGRYYIEESDYKSITSSSPLIRYLPNDNLNGSSYDIAGVGTEDGYVLGVMPHPERAVNPLLTPRGFKPGGEVIFRSILYSLKSGW